eukprot:SAG31_NODE_10942_length_1080_cov_1.305810_1_plen_165_part_00
MIKIPQCDSYKNNIIHSSEFCIFLWTQTPSELLALIAMHLDKISSSSSAIATNCVVESVAVAAALKYLTAELKQASPSFSVEACNPSTTALSMDCRSISSSMLRNGFSALSSPFVLTYRVTTYARPMQKWTLLCENKCTVSEAPVAAANSCNLQIHTHNKTYLA